MAHIQRRKSVTAKIGNVRVGGDVPVVVQSMTNTDTADVEGTIQQVAQLARAGSELVRVTVNNDAAAKAVPAIVEGLEKQNDRVPIIADFHYNGHLVLTRYPECAQALANHRTNQGIVGGAGGLAVLLQEGSGDTIRVSLTPAPNGNRAEEVFVGQQILQSMGIRSFAPQVTACPGCGRTTSTFFQEMAEEIQSYLRTNMPVWKGKYPGIEELKVAVMGCVVNGPGESKHANIGISLPGTFEDPKAQVFVDGRLMTTLKGDRIVAEFIDILNEYIDARYGSGSGQTTEGVAASV